jgi:hypothetical protein
MASVIFFAEKVGKERSETVMINYGILAVHIKKFLVTMFCIVQSDYIKLQHTNKNI